MTWPPSLHTAAVLALVLVASVCDLRTGRVPNILTLGAAALAVASHSLSSGWSGAVFAGAGWTVGLLLFLPLYAVKGMGAGDVKLLAAVGAWLGPRGAGWTALYAALAGGALALVVSVARGYTGTALRNVGFILRLWSITGIRPVEGLTLESSAAPRLPYALPIALGAVATLWRL